MRTLGGRGVYSFLTAAVDGGQRSASPSDLVTPGNEPRYPLSRMLGGQQSRSGRYGEEKNIFPLPGFETWTVEPLVRSLYTLRILITHGRWQLSVAN
jgi:hypothetical protein